MLIWGFMLSFNVLQLSVVADLEALNCEPSTNLIQGTNLHLSTKPAILPPRSSRRVKPMLVVVLAVINKGFCPFLYPLAIQILCRQVSLS